MLRSGGVCSTRRGNKKVIQNLVWKMMCDEGIWEAETQMGDNIKIYIQKMCDNKCKIANKSIKSVA